MRGILCGLVATLCLATPAAARPSHYSEPFELYKGHIFVMAYVDGRGPYRFGFDTGASGNGRVDAQLASELALTPAGTAETSDGITTASADMVSIGRLRFGPIEKRDLKLISRDYNGGRNDAHAIQGIIARDFFADWVVTIDYPKRTISFSRTHLRKGERGVVAYGPSFSVPVCFANGCFTGKLDTGSSRAVVVPKDVAGKLRTTEPVKIGEAKRTNGVATLYEMTLLEPLRVSGVTSHAQKLLVADPSDNMINVGSDFLKDYVLTIDQSRRLLFIRPH